MPPQAPCPHPLPPPSVPAAAPPRVSSSAPSSEVEQGLRRAVLALKQASPRGRLAPVVWAGLPGAEEPGAVCSFQPEEHRLDHDTRLEAAVALAHRVVPKVEAPMLWLTRSGDLEPTSSDLRWQAAAVAAWQEVGLAPSFAVLTRHGWRHHPSGAERRWRRLRQR
ncbi:hypothetical protein [Nocardioides campestrisoli]|uniref:hypothetical protein n=1 Tax=Nocardioides campestrisoli TaxID=2736757 RepID=UPI00163D68DC|nr:hypothetical protein [Nocardioides campestrisoli]